MPGAGGGADAGCGRSQRSLELASPSFLLRIGRMDGSERLFSALAVFFSAWVCPLVLVGVACRAVSSENAVRRARSGMVKRQIEDRGMTNPQVLEVMGRVPRHEFVPEAYRHAAYEDRPLPIDHDQTISQPYIVAAMTSLLNPEPNDIILEVGTGSGYQAAVLAELVEHVYSVEIVAELGARAKATLQRLGYDNVTTWVGDGYLGDPKHAPFDGIIVTAAPEKVPPALLEQLRPGARLVIPVGGESQELMVYERRSEPGGGQDGEFEEWSVFGVRFVPMTGASQK